MNTKEEEFLKRLQAVFHIEAEEHINVLSSGLIELEKNPQNTMSPELIETIFREAHSLKGAARSVNRSDIESVCLVLENTFAKLKNEQISLTAEQFDILHKAIDALTKMIAGTVSIPSHDHRKLLTLLRSISEPDQSKNNSEAVTPALRTSSSEIVQQRSEAPSAQDLFIGKKSPEGHTPVDQAIKKESSPVESVEEKPLQLETVRIQTAKLDLLFLQAEQMIQSKIASVQRTVELQSICDFIGAWKTELRKHETRRSVDSKLQLKEIMMWTNEQLDETERNIGTVTHAIENDQRSLGRMIDDHVDSMKKVLMLPVATMLEVFPRLVRDLARSQGKEVELLLVGKEIEVDKRILEELKDPLIHLLRN